MSLIKEFAVEPRVMAKWSHFVSLWDDFGVGNGRLISQYPLLWKSKVDELAKQLSSPVRASTISAKIRRDTHKFLFTGRTFNGNADWLTNAVSHMATQPFHAIVASENPMAAKAVLVAGDFSKDDPCYTVRNQSSVPRRAADLADCGRLLLSNCEELQFIDPHFNPSEPRFKNAFEAMLQICNLPGLKRLEIHRERPDPFIPGIQHANYRRQLEDLIPAGLTLRVFFWSQKPGGIALHPRFLLTDLGGINFENGLDEGGPGEATLVTLLHHEVWQKCRADYCQTTVAFGITRESIIDIAGSG